MRSSGWELSLSGTASSDPQAQPPLQPLPINLLPPVLTPFSQLQLCSSPLLFSSLGSYLLPSSKSQDPAPSLSPPSHSVSLFCLLRLLASYPMGWWTFLDKTAHDLLLAKLLREHSFDHFPPQLPFTFLLSLLAPLDSLANWLTKTTSLPWALLLGLFCKHWCSTAHPLNCLCCDSFEVQGRGFPVAVSTALFGFI